ncbi:MAG: hypothetical protein QN213_06905 [Armatimonadota bacterium]|nr:hypothetical protein [Armatimonadota bacterium]MDR5689641.1 hypothetical protein [Armatimonadota bacterium]MDR7392653.1 hypothetical protein [Armatimonadota bacterium]MDR7397662.1 hypothetical protein [Armatimonadota bacterium]MDR7429683.1 hypothetical protein [Armatimonadota bacterium]
MKTTIDIPDELYRKVKARTALLGRPVRKVLVELLERWLAEQDEQEDPEVWLRRWLQLADQATSGAPPGPTAREILSEDRGHLER